jgi:transcriptional regulator with XRE-family HTH domain
MPIPNFEKANVLTCPDVLRLLRDRVRFERKRLGYTQADFALRCSIPLRTYKRFELGGCDSVEVLIRIVQGFGRAPGFDTLFPPQPVVLPPRGLEAAMLSIRKKLDEGVVKGGLASNQLGDD